MHFVLGCSRLIRLLILTLWIGFSKAAINENCSSTLWNQPSLIVNHTNADVQTDLLLNKEAEAARSHESLQELHLTSSSMIFGLSKVANESNVNGLCHLQLKHLQRSILVKQPWAIKVLDASGTKPSGFVLGHNYWLGSRELCKGVQRPLGITVSKHIKRIMHNGLISDIAPFEMDYRIIYLNHSSPFQLELKVMIESVLHIGLCVPSSCTSTEVQQLTSIWVERGMLFENDLFEVSPKVMYIKNLKLNDSFYQRRSFKLLVFFVIATAALMLIAQQLRESDLMPAKELPNDDAANELAPVESEFWHNFNAVLGAIEQRRWLKDFILCYDLKTNWTKLYALRESSAKEIPVINGLRSICAVLILMFHLVWYMFFTLNNKAAFMSYFEHLTFPIVCSGPMLVEVFFIISGFLQTHNFLRNSEQMAAIRQNGWLQNVQLYGKLLCHRYLRLAPLYFIILVSVDLAYAYLDVVSVYHIYDNLSVAQYWWRNVFFIQNFYNFQELGMNWSWSLACEMQFFLLANILLFLYVKRPKYAQVLVIVLMVASIAWTINIGLKTKFEFTLDSALYSATEVYISPYVRVTPYIVGAIAAWCFTERGLKYELSALQERYLWHLCVLVVLAFFYTPLQRGFSCAMATLLLTFGRTVFGLCISGIILGSASGRSIWWSRLLEAKIFQHVNRLSYAIYLLNALIISLFLGLTSASNNLEPYMFWVHFCGFTFIIYLASVAFSLAFEMPYCNLSSLLLKRSSKPKSA